MKIENKLVEMLNQFAAVIDKKQIIELNIKIIEQFREQLKEIYVNKEGWRDYYRSLTHMEQDISMLQTLYNVSDPGNSQIQGILKILNASLEAEMKITGVHNTPFGEEDSRVKSLKSHFKWVGPKSRFVELIYGLYASGWFNDMEISEFSQVLSSLFGVEIINIYSDFRHIRFRKGHITVGINEMERRLNNYIRKINKEEMLKI